MSKLINAARVRKYALERAEALRAEWGPTQISGSFIEGVNSLVRRAIDDQLKRHPSRGKTVNWQG